MVSLAQARSLAAEFNIDTSVVSIATIRKAIAIELEHKKIIGDRIDLAFMIALAHLEENPIYYQILEKMEAEAKKFWATRQKPSIYKI